MNNKYLQNPSVMLERLSPVVIDALQGHVVQNIKMLQSLPTLNMTMLSMLLRRKVLHQMQAPCSEVILERLPEDCNPSRVITQKERTLNCLAMTKENKSTTSINNVKSLQVTLERLPMNIINILTQKKVHETKKQKRRVGRPKKYMNKDEPNVYHNVVILRVSDGVLSTFPAVLRDLADAVNALGAHYHQTRAAHCWAQATLDTLRSLIQSH